MLMGTIFTEVLHVDDSLLLYLKFSFAGYQMLGVHFQKHVTFFILAWSAAIKKSDGNLVLSKKNSILSLLMFK